jgi:DNA-binding beta-propeller fold protein YncE
MRKIRTILLSSAATALCASHLLSADTYSTQVVASGLNRPTGIAIRGGNTIYFTEIPTPGVGGGANAVKELRLGNGSIRVIHQGEPEPVNIAVDQSGILYWTCKSAGVILEQAPHPASSSSAALLTGLAKPSGIATDKNGNVYFTQVPVPGVGGGANSVASVSVYDTSTIALLSSGEPEPADVAASDKGVLYWTCRTAGVILTRNRQGTISLLLGGLNLPVGIALDEQRDLLYWTEVPTPGVPGSMGGNNKVWVYDLKKNIKTLVDAGDPEPTDVAVAPNGRVYWTCSSAGVIVEAVRR